MSDPTSELQKLHLGDMPVTRSHTSASRASQGQTPGGSSRMNPLSRRSRQPASAIPSRTASRASFRPTDPVLTANPALAMFKIEGIDTEDQHIDFRMRPDGNEGLITASLFFDINRNVHRAICSQAEHRAHPAPCNHITVSRSSLCRPSLIVQWLIATLTRELLNPTAMQPTNENTISDQISRLYPLISRSNQSLRTRLNTFRGGETDDEASSDESEETTSSHERANLFARQDELCDILTAFRRDMLPEDFRRHYAAETPEVTGFRECLVDNDIYGTLFKLGMHDQHFYRTLRRLVPGNFRAVKVYYKQSSRAIQALEQLDQDAAANTLNPRSSVPQCAQQVRQIVHEIYEDLSARVARSTISQRAGAYCAARLVYLMEAVVKRQYQELFSGASVPAGMPARNGSIYKFLISDAPRSDSMESWQRDLFVLERLPQTVWVELYDRLDAILNDIREHSDSEPAATRYTERLARLLNDYNMRFDEPSSSSGQPRMPVAEARE